MFKNNIIAQKRLNFYFKNSTFYMSSYKSQMNFQICLTPLQNLNLLNYLY